MSRIFYLCLAILVVGCSSTTSRKKSYAPEGEPEWLYAASSGCDDSEICASATGTSFKESDSSAKKALAGIFASKIKAEFKFSRQSFSNKEVSEMKESIEDKVNVQIDQILKGAYIKERFKKDGLMFSLASLKKADSMNILTQELTRIDDKMQHYFSLRNRLYMKTLNMLYNQREILNEKLVIINETGIPRKITFSQINDLKYSSGKSAKIKLQSSGDMPTVLLKKFEEALTDVGYEITDKDDSSFIVKVSFKANEEYLNVSGFKKYSFEVAVDAKSSAGKSIGGYVLNLVANGRTRKDAFLKVRPKFVSQIENNLPKLNLK